MFSVHICALFVVVLLLSDARAAIQLAKMIKYMGGDLSCDIVFGLFMVSWLITRHILFILVIITTYVDLPRSLTFKWDPANGNYVTDGVYIGFLVLMGLLQVRSVSSLRFASRLTSIPTSGASTDLVLYDIEGRLQGYHRTRSGGCSE
jgi:acyl-CoA-dependent ceramide synthase